MQQGEKLMPNPTPLSASYMRRLAENVDVVAAVKHTGCAFYNECLEQAVQERWQGFGCHQCMSYCEPDPHQKMMDHIRLRALGKAVEILERDGKLNRVRGVKQGADAKRTVREESAPLALALG